MVSALYSREILGLASSLIHDDRLVAADASVQLRAPLCGSRIEADVQLDGKGKITATALRANACALGQASAAILRGHAVGLDAEMLRDIRMSIAAYFSGDGDMIEIWPQLTALSVAKDYPARHAAILLPYDALLAAIEQGLKQLNGHSEAIGHG